MGRFIRVFLLVILALVVTVSANIDRRLVNADGEAWVGNFGRAVRGYIFHSDGSAQQVVFRDGRWQITFRGRWWINKNRIVIAGTVRGSSYRYSLQGNVFRLHNTGKYGKYTRVQVFPPTTQARPASQPTPPPPPAPQRPAERPLERVIPTPRCRNVIIMPLNQERTWWRVRNDNPYEVEVSFEYLNGGAAGAVYVGGTGIRTDRQGFIVPGGGSDFRRPRTVFMGDSTSTRAIRPVDCWQSD